MTDQELAAHWDADHRLAATVSLVAGAVVAVGTGLLFTVGLAPIEAINQGKSTSPFAVTMVAALMLLVDVALLAFVVGLAHALTEGRPFVLALSTAVATLATTVSAALHLVWGNVAAALEVGLPVGIVQFVTWLAANLWLLPLFALLVGATLLALSLALHFSDFRFARRLGTASAVVGGILCALAPFTGYEPGQPAWAMVVVTTVAVVGISALLLVALVRLGMMLRGVRHAERTV